MNSSNAIYFLRPQFFQTKSWKNLESWEDGICLYFSRTYVYVTEHRTLRNFFIFVIIIRFFSFSTEVSRTHYVHIFHTLMDLFYYVTVDPAWSKCSRKMSHKFLNLSLSILKSTLVTDKWTKFIFLLLSLLLQMRFLECFFSITFISVYKIGGRLLVFPWHSSV